MLLIDQQGQATSCAEIPPGNARALASPLATRILHLLAQESDGLHASAIAKRLREPEQKIHYHVRRLRDAGAIAIDRIEETSGAGAKVLRIAAPAIALRYASGRAATARVKGGVGTPREEAFLAPFIANGAWDARIVVGSPDPHGPESARGRDAAYAIDLGLFFGGRAAMAPGASVQLDTELRSWNANLVIIGGPVVNKAAARLNERKDSPVAYDTERKAFRTPAGWFDAETGGVIVKMPNPFARGKWILWIAGKRHTGTRAAILAFLTAFPTVCEVARTGRHATWIAVEGVDADSDGIVDAVRFPVHET